jgi:hypothetical protein
MQPSIARPTGVPALWRRFVLTLEMIRYEHSIFALPFALTAALLAWRRAGPLWPRMAWILLCMLTARSAAMAFNRVLDADIDARNPRTRARHLPAGLLSRLCLGLHRRDVGRVLPLRRPVERALSETRAGRAGHRLLLFLD